MDIDDIIAELQLCDADAHLEVLVDGQVIGKVVLVCEGDGEPYLEVRGD